MAQLSIRKEETPATLTIRVHQDPYDPKDHMIVQAAVRAVDGSMIAAQSVTLRGMEQDFLDSLVEVVLLSYRFGNPAADLAVAMRRIKRKAFAHKRAHGG